MDDFHRLNQLKEMNHLVYGVYTQFLNLDIEYIPTIFRILFQSIETVPRMSKDSIDYFLKIWSYILFVCQFDCGYQLNVLDRDLFIKYLEGDSSFEDLKGNQTETILFKVLNDFIGKGQDIDSF